MVPAFWLPGRPWSLTERLLTAAGVVIGLGALGYGLWRGYVGYTKHGLVPACLWPRPYLIIGALALLFTLGYAFSCWRRAHTLWRLAPQGISPASNRPFLPWDEVLGLLVDFTPHRQYLTLITTQGRWRIAPHPSALRHVLPYLEAQLYPRLSARWRTLWAQGKSIPLGRWQAWPDGIQVGHRRIPWRAMQRLYIDQGLLVIELAQRAWRQPVRHVPNASLFVRWLHQEGHT